MNIIIIDDEQTAIDLLMQELTTFEAVTVLKTFTNVKSALEFIPISPIDVIFSDIEMPFISGIDFAQMVYNLKPTIKIVFVSAFDQYAIDAYQLGIVDYLLKPVTKKRLAIFLQRFLPIITESSIPDLIVTSFSMFTINFRGKEVKWRTKKAKELAAYLFFNEGKSISMDTLIRDVLNLLPDNASKKTLHSLMYYARKNLKDAGISDIIELDEDCYILRIKPEKYFFDYRNFKRIEASTYLITNEDNINDLTKLFDLYTGDLFDLENYFWSQEIQSYMKIQYEKLLYNLAEYYKNIQNYSKSASYLQLLLDRDIFNDQANHLKLSLYLLQNDENGFSDYLQWITTLYSLELGEDFNYDE